MVNVMHTAPNFALSPESEPHRARKSCSDRLLSPARTRSALEGAGGGMFFEHVFIFMAQPSGRVCQIAASGIGKVKEQIRNLAPRKGYA